jgi:hypothetical protein
LKKYNLNIANYKIRFEAADTRTDLKPSKRFVNFICGEVESDLAIAVHNEIFKIPDDANRVFHAPLVEERDDKLIKTDENFWSIYQNKNNIYIKTVFPYSDSDREAIAELSFTSNKWDLYFSRKDGETDPFEYPLDGLILYYLASMSGDIMIHASGVKYSGNGFLFSGISGKGKSTMAGIWKSAGGEVIHDDRLIIRKVSDKYKMFNTPVYEDDIPKESFISGIYLIEHGNENKLIPLKGSAAMSSVMANCIQQNWDRGMIERLMGSLSEMCSKVPVSRLYFRPDAGIVNFLTHKPAE